MSCNKEEHAELTHIFLFPKPESRNHIEKKDCSNLLLKCEIWQMAKKPLKTDCCFHQYLPT